MSASLAEKLAQRPCFGVSCRLTRTTDIAAMLRDCGYDWMFLDLEHGPLSMDQITQTALAGVEAGVTPLVRVADAAPGPIHRVLSNGAMGVIVPHVDDPETAAAIARECRFPPHGHRSVPGILPQLGYAPRSFADAAKILDPITLCAVMIESRTAVEAVDEIASVDGVDILFVGASDLTFQLGKPSAYGDPEMVAAMEKVAAAAQRHGKVCGFGGVADADMTRRYIDFGMNFILAGNDQTMFLQGARARLAALTGKG
ncbi:HpcH/HpaI aldolase/citrate lyase family protein [Puniceibacterium sp. IMCC21224]|uniref:HpcH/HpaI aldolase family protein n=1 Tax=Puniceibacterium sp. IMCC21224 TaxID=1618204 RepID=UPI00064D7544|nr:aldolase/citrate lyase family protein [Puniceibacterium sp. IMCC21224]KMK64879.1 2,4-dihydroxyhept-2-ene-1,7-dioic acid aldolase [Puniceibacterium sp. IMCC21224]